MSTETPRGDCFTATLRFLLRPENDHCRLVHGNLSTLRQDTLVNHAWIEEGDTVREVVGGRNDTHDKRQYYDMLEVTNTRVYTRLEAFERYEKHHHCGPWD